MVLTPITIHIHACILYFIKHVELDKKHTEVMKKCAFLNMISGEYHYIFILNVKSCYTGIALKRDELRQYETVQKWDQRVKLQGSHLSTLHNFVKWYSLNYEKVTPDDLITIQSSLSEAEKYSLLDKVQKWVSSHRGRQGTKRVKYSQIRSFFAHNRAELPSDPGYSPRSEIPAVVGELEPEEIKQILLSSNKLYRALFLCMFQAALDSEMFIYWNSHGWEELRDQLTQNMDPIKISLPGRKLNRNIKPYYSFITTDAIKALRDYLPEQLPREREYIFVNQAGTGVSKVTLRNYFRRHLKQLGMVKGYDTEDPHIQTRYGKNPHEMRDTFRSLWDKSPASGTVAEYCMGHSIDSLGYNKSFTDEAYYRKEYSKAAPFLNLLSKTEPFGLVESDEVDKLRNEVKQLKQMNEELEQRLNNNLNVSMDEVEEMVRKIMAEQMKKQKPE